MTFVVNMTLLLEFRERLCVCVCMCECSVAHDDIQNIPRNFARLYFASLPFAFPYFPLCLRIELRLMCNLGLGQT